MFNRVFLFVIALVSIVWITYVGYDLLDQKDKINPQNIFDSKDGEILIINRTKEMDLIQVDFEPLASVKPMLNKMLLVPYKNERIYVSKNRELMLVELPSLWSATMVKDFFGSREIKCNATGSNTFSLDDGFLARFKRNFLLISKAEIESTDEELQWPVWDKKATASIIQLNQPLRSTDVYFKADGTISYQTRYSKDINSKKVDDQDLFAEVLPNKLKNYHFFESKFALASDVLAEESPLLQWAESGFVLFDYQGKSCIISDYVSGQDPFVIVNEKTSNTDSTSSQSKTRIKNVRLTKHFPKNLSQGFYMMYVADKVVISESKEACEQIVADHQLGKTIALTEAARTKIYQKLPRKVSERYVTGTIAYAQSAHKNILIRTQIAKLISDDVPDEAPAAVQELNWTQSIDGEVLQFLGRGNQQFIWSSSGKLIAVSNKKRRWQIELDGRPINEPQFIDLLDNGKEQILFNTASSIYLIDLNGSNHEGFPVKLENEATNSVSYFRWKGVGNFLVVNDKSELLHFDNRGRELDVVKLNVGICKNAVDVFNQKGNIIAVVSGSENTQTVNLLRHKVVKTHGAIPQDRIAIKGNDGPNYYSFEKGELQRRDYTGSEITLANYPNPTHFRTIEGKNFKYIAFASYGKIHVLNERGIKMFQFDIPFRELASFDVITLQNGKTYIAMIDAIENNLYVFDNSGRCYTDKPLEGKNEVLLSEKGGNNLVVTTSGNGFIVQYFDVLKKKSSVQGQHEDE